MRKHECEACGLAACDLPAEMGWSEDALDDFFYGGLCAGCDDND